MWTNFGTRGRQNDGAVKNHYRGRLSLHLDHPTSHHQSSTRCRRCGGLGEKPLNMHLALV